MSVGETAGWYTDGSVVRGDFTLCAVPADIPPPPMPPPSPPPPPPPPPAPPVSQGVIYWNVQEGASICQVTYGGAASPTPAPIRTTSAASIQAVVEMTVSATYYDVQPNDFIREWEQTRSIEQCDWR